MIMKDYAEPFTTQLSGKEPLTTQLSGKEPFTTEKKNTFEGIVLTFLGVVCYISSGFVFAYAILGGY